MKLARVIGRIDDTSIEDTNNAANASTPHDRWVLVQPLDERLELVGEAHPAWNQIGARQDEIVVLAPGDPASPAYNEEQSTPAGSTIVIGIVDSIEVLARENIGVEKHHA